MTADIGFTGYGGGPSRVIVLHDWFCDCSSWEGVAPYLSGERHTYAFADLRGYGLSRKTPGEGTLEEAAADVRRLADRLRWERFALVGHSMSSLVVQRLAQLAPERVERVVAVTPVSPTGMALEVHVEAFFRGLALASDEERLQKLRALWGDRLSEGWIRFKARRWRETADPEMVARYVGMWGATDISAGARAVRAPLLIVAAEQDAPPFRKAGVEAGLLPFYPHARVVALAESGHYPMQEQPPRLAAEIERFLGE